METREERMEAVYQILDEVYAHYAKSTGRRKVSDASFARYLHIGNQALSMYLSKTRLPDLEHCITLSENPLIGVRIFTACGYPIVTRITDDRLWLILRTWRTLNTDEREQFLNRMEQYLASGSGDDSGCGDKRIGGADDLDNSELEEAKTGAA